MSQILYQLDDNSLTFPPVDNALTDPNGLLALGGDLTSKRLINAYSHGIFPWYSDGDPFMWWSPDPRAIIDISELRINRTLRKAINKSPYQITLNEAFTQVTAMCSDAPFRSDETWILPEMLEAYTKLHQLGFAHSIEVWSTNDDNKRSLVGGLYGVAINGFFSGESMFYTQNNASKFALVALGKLLSVCKVDFIDCQMLNPFLEDMGAKEISRESFIQKQQKAMSQTIPKTFWVPRELTL